MTRERHPRQDLSAFLDGALAPGPAAEVRDHLAHCPSCREEEARLRGAIAALASLPPAPDIPPFFATRLEARLREERGRSRRPGLLGWLGGLAASFPRPRLAVVAAAVVLVGGVALRSWLDTRAMVRDLDLL